ncbi:hypothetical protein ACFLQJ_02730 [Calditrichota bacterium]
MRTAIDIIDIPFKDDQQLIPDRWVETRKKYRTSREFIRRSKWKGHNRSITMLFSLLILANIGLITGLNLITRDDKMPPNEAAELSNATKLESNQDKVDSIKCQNQKEKLKQPSKSK